MNILFDRPFETIDEKDLSDLIEIKKVREYVSLDYKQTSYSHNHEGAIKLLSDITAMANSRGGYIIIGVEEDKASSDGTPKCIVGIEEGDIEANWIQSISLSSIDETIIGLRVRDISLANGKHCILIQIPNSTRKPHMVVHEKHRSFRIRHGRLNAIIGMREVRDMIINMSSYQIELKTFLQDRIEANSKLATNDPFLLLMATPIYIGSDRINPLQNELKELLENVPGSPNNKYSGIRVVGRASARIFGSEVGPRLRPPDNKTYNALRLFRNGHFEYFENYKPQPDINWPTEPMPLYSYRIVISLLHFLIIAKRIYSTCEISDPITLNLIIGNNNRSYLKSYNRGIYYPDEVYLWQEKLLPIDLTVSDIENPYTIAAEITDRLFNAYAKETNLHFHNETKELLPEN